MAKNKKECIKSYIDMNVESNDLIEVIRVDYKKLAIKVQLCMSFEKYCDFVLRHEELKRVDRHCEDFGVDQKNICF